MKKLIVTHWVSLDGFIADRSGALDWVMGDDDMSAYEIGVVSDADTLLLGKNTYRDFAGYWPHVGDNPNAAPWEKTYGAKLNALHKVVVSRTLQEPLWAGTEIVRDVAAVERLKGGTGKTILLYGSATLVQQLADLGTIDEYHLLVHPIVLGGGKPLFGDVERRVKLNRGRTEQFKSGVSLLVYQKG